MRLLRSWPAEVPDGRAHVVDGMERLVIKDFRYDPWLNRFLIRWFYSNGTSRCPARAPPVHDRAKDVPRPRLLRPVSAVPDDPPQPPLNRPVWSARYDNGQVVEEFDPYCHLFSLGMTYLPQAAIAGYFAAMETDDHLAQEGFTDGAFSGWWWRTSGLETPLFWDVRPVHLHYRTPKVT